MKILSIDTASDICGVSILENENLVCCLDSNTGHTHSENLLPMINEALLNANTELSDIDLIVCDKGPGSFTGIRIGIATVKAFCDSLGISCISVSSLEALAYNIHTSGLICSLIDCKNNNCYYALYKLKNNKFLELIPPSTDSLSNILSKLTNFNDNITFVGNGSLIYKNTISTSLFSYSFANENALSSFYLALAGLSKYKDGLVDRNILPLYLKKPQAQNQLEEKLRKEFLDANK